MKDIFGFKQGIFKLIEEDSLGKQTVIEESNTIVNSSFLVITGALTGDTNKRITSLALGDGGVVNSVKQTPNVLDTALYHELIRLTSPDDIAIESILKPFYITFKFELGTAEGNGIGAQIYNEAGLFSNDGTMFARKTFTTAVKTPEKKFLVEWKLEYLNS